MPTTTIQEQLTEPLLASSPGEEQAVVCLVEYEEEEVEHAEDAIGAARTSNSSNSSSGNDDGAVEQEEEELFSYTTEFYEMMTLGIPLCVSFFCRMGMASTDSSFVGHLNDEHYTAETYLAAAVLSDMVVSTLITPPLAFNQVLNALVGQAMGSGNPKMAGIWLQQSIFWLSLTMLPCLVGFFYVERILLALDFSVDVARVAGVYAQYNVFWPVPNGIYQCMRFYFQAQGLPRPAMYNNILFLFVNALLNWIFVFGGPFQYLADDHVMSWHGLGFVGAAISLSISRSLQPVVYFLYMFVYKQHHQATWPDATRSLFENHTAARTLEFMKQSIPNIGTLLFQVLASQVTTVLVGRLGELSIAASSALSTVTIPWSGSLSATCSTIAGVRVGYHLGRGRANAARQSTYMLLYFITITNVVMAALFMSPRLRGYLLNVATDDEHVLQMASTLVPAMLLGTYLNLMVGTITSGVFSGMGRPFIATLLSFGLELPMSIGGVAIYILYYHGNLLGVYWWQAISGGIEVCIVLAIMMRSNWKRCAREAQARQEVVSSPLAGQSDIDGVLTDADDPEASLMVGLIESSNDGTARIS
jgi:multidrug resistance protein, MATE family